MEFRINGKAQEGYNACSPQDKIIRGFNTVGGSGPHFVIISALPTALLL